MILKHHKNEFFQTKIIIYEPNLLELHIKNASLAFLNSIRRIIIEELPGYAITKVIIKKYNGLLPEEVLAHRLGQIPIFLDPIENMEFRMNLKKNGPGSVLSNHIKIYNNDGKEIFSFSELSKKEESKKLPMLKQNVLVTKQLEEDFIDAEMYASKSCGKDHSKHSVVNVCFYRLVREIKLTKELYGNDAINIQQILGKDIIKIQEGQAILINNLVDISKIEDAGNSVTVIDDNEENAIFVIETEFLDPMEVFRRGIFLLMEKTKKLKEDLKSFNE